ITPSQGALALHRQVALSGQGRCPETPGFAAVSPPRRQRLGEPLYSLFQRREVGEPDRPADGAPGQRPAVGAERRGRPGPVQGKVLEGAAPAPPHKPWLVSPATLGREPDFVPIPAQPRGAGQARGRLPSRQVMKPPLPCPLYPEQPAIRADTSQVLTPPLAV